MEHARIAYVGSLIAAALSICTTGCMISPQHGQDIGRIDSQILFYGATTQPGQRLEIQALNPRGGWEAIGSATTGDVAMELESGTWYGWMNIWVSVPRRYWSDAGGGRMSAMVRVRSLDGDILGNPALLTFEDGFDPNDYTDVGTMWEEYGHGRYVTIYGHR